MRKNSQMKVSNNSAQKPLQRSGAPQRSFVALPSLDPSGPRFAGRNLDSDAGSQDDDSLDEG